MLEKLDIASTALVLIDLQEGILNFSFSPYSGQAVRSAGAELAKGFRAAGGLVVLTRVVYASDFADALQQPVDNPLPSGALPSNWSVFSPELAVSAEDLIVDKRNWGAFYGTDLELQLVRRGIKTIVIGGVATNMGVESTARDAHERNYDLIFADGAISSMSEDMHRFAMGTIFPLIGRIRSVGDVLGALK